MSILLVGDLHGEAFWFRQAYQRALDEGASAIIQVGDFGLMRENEHLFREIAAEFTLPFYFIDGNHDDCERWSNYEHVVAVFRAHNLFYIPRGSVFEVDDRKFLCVGGAASIDKEIRLRNGWHWTPKENISDDFVDTILEKMHGVTIDAMITHAPPLSVADRFFDSIEKIKFGVGLDWFDPNMKRIEHIWKTLGSPRLYCGHMHRTLDENNCRILNINEFLLI